MFLAIWSVVTRFLVFRGRDIQILRCSDVMVGNLKQCPHLLTTSRHVGPQSSTNNIVRTSRVISINQFKTQRMSSQPSGGNSADAPSLITSHAKYAVGAAKVDPAFLLALDRACAGDLMTEADAIVISRKRLEM